MKTKINNKDYVFPPVYWLACLLKPIARWLVRKEIEMLRKAVGTKKG